MKLKPLSLSPPNEAGLRLLKTLLKAVSFLFIGLLMIVCFTGVSVAGEISIQLTCATIILAPLGFFGGRLARRWGGSARSWYFIMILPMLLPFLIVCHFVWTSPPPNDPTDFYSFLSMLVLITTLFYLGNQSSFNKNLE